jgi:prophage antirepressor-like protein
MTNELSTIPFNGADIRTAEYEGRRVAYMPDVAQTFGLRTNNIIRELDAWDYISAGQDGCSDLSTQINPTRPHMASPYWLTESGIWHLAYKVSPELRRKVNEEVLPELRKTGAYVSQPTSQSVSRKRRPRLYNEDGYPFASGVEYMLGHGAYSIPTPHGPILFNQENIPAHVFENAMLEAAEGESVARVTMTVQNQVSEQAQSALGQFKHEAESWIAGEVHRRTELALVKRDNQFTPSRKQGNPHTP